MNQSTFLFKKIEASEKFDSSFKNYNFLTTSDDMFTPAEDLLLKQGSVLHGTAIGWSIEFDMPITKLDIVSNRFYGLKYQLNDTSILAYSVYLPTSGQDDFFIEVLSELKYDIEQNISENCAIIAGLNVRTRICFTKVFLLILPLVYQ